MTHWVCWCQLGLLYTSFETVMTFALTIRSLFWEETLITILVFKGISKSEINVVREDLENVKVTTSG
jgi:hypothetical protein